MSKNKKTSAQKSLKIFCDLLTQVNTSSRNTAEFGGNITISPGI